MAPLPLDKYNYPVVDLTTMSTSVPGVFCGGDLAKVASTTVESVNDGKTAAWHIHRFLQVRRIDQLVSVRYETHPWCLGWRKYPAWATATEVLHRYR